MQRSSSKKKAQHLKIKFSQVTENDKEMWGILKKFGQVIKNDNKMCDSFK